MLKLSIWYYKFIVVTWGKKFNLSGVWRMGKVQPIHSVFIIGIFI